MDTKEFQRQAIDESIRALKLHRNTLAPISNLPFEVLTLIFRFIVIQSRDSTAMLPITHVCQLWRRVALDCPALWTHVTGSNFSLQIASRSKDVPIHILLTRDREFDQRLSQLIIEFVFANVHRIQEILFDVPVSLLKDLIQSLSEPALLLEVVEIICRDSVVKIDFSRLSRCQVPRMRQLSLDAVDITWDEWFVCNLTSLTLRSVPLDVAQLPVILKATPKLQILRICEDVEHEEPVPYAGGISNPDNPVQLLNLSNMTFVGAFGNCFFLMTHLVLPHLASITVSAWMSAQPPPNLVELLIQHLFHGTIPSVHFTVSVAGLKFATHTRVLEMVDVKDLTLYLEPGFRQLHTPSSVHITLSKALLIEENDWEAALGWLDRLTFLNLTLNDSGRIFLRALIGSLMACSSSSSKGAILFPALEQLTVHVAVDPEVEDRFFELRNFLQHRNDIGSGIMQIDIVMRRGDPRPLSDAELDQLSDLVEFVEWEEREAGDGPV
jgi:F-box-like